MRQYVFAKWGEDNPYKEDGQAYEQVLFAFGEIGFTKVLKPIVGYYKRKKGEYVILIPPKQGSSRHRKGTYVIFRANDGSSVMVENEKARKILESYLPERYKRFGGRKGWFGQSLRHKIAAFKRRK